MVTKQITKIETDCQQSISKIKTACEETIEQVKAQFLAKENFYNESIAQINAQAGQSTANVRAIFEQQISQIKAEAEQRINFERQERVRIEQQAKAAAEDRDKAYQQQIAKIKGDNDESMAKIKAAADEAVAKVKAEFASREESFKEQISADRSEAEENSKAYEEQIAKIERDCEKSILKVKVAANEAVAKVKAEFASKEESYKQQILTVGPEVEEKSKADDEQIAKMEKNCEESILKAKTAANVIIAKVDAEARDKESFYIKSVAELKDQSEKSAANIRACLEEQILQVKSEAAEAIARGEIRAKAETNDEIVKLKAEFALKEESYREQLLTVRSEAACAIAKEKARKDELTKIIAKAGTAEEKSRAYEQQIAKIEGDYEESIAMVKAVADDSIAKVKAEFVSKEEGYREQLLTVMSEAEGNLRIHEEQLAQIKQELGIKMVRTKIEANKAIAVKQIRIKELENQIVRLSKMELSAAGKLTPGGAKIDSSMSDIKRFAEKIASITKNKDFTERPAIRFASVNDIIKP